VCQGGPGKILRRWQMKIRFPPTSPQFSWQCVKVFAIPGEQSASKLAHKKQKKVIKINYMAKWLRQ